MWPNRNPYSHIVREFLAKQNRPNCTHVQCDILTEAMENVDSRALAVQCIICKTTTKP